MEDTDSPQNSASNRPDDGAHLSDLLGLPEALQPVVRSLRQIPSFTLADLTALAGTLPEGEALLDDLQERGLIEAISPVDIAAPTEAEPRYRLRLQGRRRSPLGDALWQKLEDPDHE